MSLISDYEDMASGDWQREYLFRLVLEPPALVAPLYPAEFDVFVNNFKAPGSKQKVIKKDWAGQWANFAGPLDNPGTTELEIQVDENGVISKFFEAWHDLSGTDMNDSAYPKNLIVGTAHVTMYKTDKETPVQTVSLYRVWVPEVGDLSLNKSGENLLSRKILFAYDRRGSVYHS